MSLELTLIVVILAPLIGGMVGVISWAFGWLNQGYKKVIKNIIMITGVAIYISFLIIGNFGSKINPQTTYKEYPIQYLTTNKVYFNDNDGYSLNETNVTIEESDYEQNVVIVEKTEYEVQWLWKVPLVDKTYYIYLTNENYERLQNKDVIWNGKK